MLCHAVVFRRRRRLAYAPVIHATSHFYHEKRVAWVSFSMHIFDPVPIVMGLRMAALGAAGAPLLYFLYCLVHCRHSICSQHTVISVFPAEYPETVPATITFFTLGP